MARACMLCARQHRAMFVCMLCNKHASHTDIEMRSASRRTRFPRGRSTRAYRSIDRYHESAGCEQLCSFAIFAGHLPRHNMRADRGNISLQKYNLVCYVWCSVQAAENPELSAVQAGHGPALSLSRYLVPRTLRASVYRTSSSSRREGTGKWKCTARNSWYQIKPLFV